MNAAFLASSSCARCLRARCDPNSRPAEDGARSITSPNMVAVEVEEGNQSVVREQEIYGQENITEDMRPEASTKKNQCCH